MTSQSNKVTWLSFHLSNSHLMEHFKPPNNVSSLSVTASKKHTDLFTFSTLHFTRLLKDGVTEIAAAQTVVTLNVDLALFLMEGTCGRVTLPLEQNGN